MTDIRVAIIAITKHGAAIASRLAPLIPEAVVVFPKTSRTSGRASKTAATSIRAH